MSKKLIKKFQKPSGPIAYNRQEIEESLKEAKEDLKRLFPEEYGKTQDERSLYQRLNDSNFGKALDYIDLGLDVASMIPYIGPYAAAAGTITGLPQGVLAVDDMIKNGVTFENTTDALKLIPFGIYNRCIG